MRIALASDHAGFEMKNVIAGYLAQEKLEFQDFGSDSTERVDYVDYAEMAIKGFVAGQFDRIILVCGTGMGMSVVANKFRSVRATLCCNEYMAEMSRKHNDSNCLTLGGRVLAMEEAVKIVRVWVKTDFEGGRHQQRLDKIAQIEANNFM
jgi:ribose 5-phosphate isomerase B